MSQQFQASVFAPVAVRRSSAHLLADDDHQFEMASSTTAQQNDMITGIVGKAADGVSSGTGGAVVLQDIPSCAYYGLLSGLTIDLIARDQQQHTVCRGISARNEQWISLLKERCSHYQHGPDLMLSTSSGGSSGASPSGGAASSSPHPMASTKFEYCRYIDALCDAFSKFWEKAVTSVGSSSRKRSRSASVGSGGGGGGASKAGGADQASSDWELPSSLPYLYLLCQKHPRIRNFSASFFLEDDNPSCFIACDSPFLRRYLTESCAVSGVGLDWVDGACLVQQSVQGTFLHQQMLKKKNENKHQTHQDEQQHHVMETTMTTNGGGSKPTVVLAQKGALAHCATDSVSVVFDAILNIDLRLFGGDTTMATTSTTTTSGSRNRDSTTVLSATSSIVCAKGMTIATNFPFQFGELRCPSIRQQDPLRSVIPMPVARSTTTMKAGAKGREGQEDAEGVNNRCFCFPWVLSMGASGGLTPTMAPPPLQFPTLPLLLPHALPNVLRTCMETFPLNEVIVSTWSAADVTLGTSPAASASVRTAGSGKPPPPGGQQLAASGGGGGPFQLTAAASAKQRNTHTMNLSDKYIFSHAFCFSRLCGDAGWITPDSKVRLFGLDEEDELEFVPNSVHCVRGAVVASKTDGRQGGVCNVGISTRLLHVFDATIGDGESSGDDYDGDDNEEFNGGDAGATTAE